MRRNTAKAINMGEWLDIMELPKVRKTFGLGDFAEVNNFASRVYGAKFPYTMHMSDEAGFIYILVGNVKKGEVLMLEESNGVFKVMK